VIDRRLPYDQDLERAVLAEIIDPLHRVRALDEVGPEDFADGRHQRIMRHRLAGESFIGSDVRYAAGCTQWAHPLVHGDVEQFFALAARRREVLRLAYRIEELLAEGVAA
jgi:hypothetical protein